MPDPMKFTRLYNLLTAKACPTVFKDDKTILDLAEYLHKHGVIVQTRCKDCRYGVDLDETNSRCELDDYIYDSKHYCDLGEWRDFK